MILKFEFDENKINLILQALGELPAKISLGLINEIQSTCRQQMNIKNNNSMIEKPEPPKSRIISNKKEDKNDHNN